MPLLKNWTSGNLELTLILILYFFLLCKYLIISVNKNAQNTFSVDIASDPFLAPTGAQGEAMSCVRPCVCHFSQIMSSSSILKSPRGF